LPDKYILIIYLLCTLCDYKPIKFGRK